LVSPSESDSQCAALEQLGLVDGIVSDDSDIFLFGGRTVYKHVFDKQHGPCLYSMNDIEQSLGLSRRELIRLAYLLGSDYTEGVKGIGVVYAVLILNEFLDDFKKPNEELTSDDVVKALLQFKEWIESDNDDTANTTEFKRAHKTLKKKIELSRDFPRQEVALAYLKPAVDLSTEEFQWGVPNLSALRTFVFRETSSKRLISTIKPLFMCLTIFIWNFRYCLSKFGWSSEKTDDKLLPVIRKYNTIDQREPRDNIFEGLPRPVPNKPRSAKLEQTLHQIAQKRSSFLNTVDQQLRERYHNNNLSECKQIYQGR